MRAHIYIYIYIYTYYLLLRTSETRYYWITFLIRPLFPPRETEKKQKRRKRARGKRIESSVLLLRPLPLSLRERLSRVPGALFLVSLHIRASCVRIIRLHPTLTSFSFSSSRAFSLLASAKREREGVERARPRGVSSTFVFRMELLCRRFHLLYMRASAPLQTSTFSLRLIELPGGLCILNRRLLSFHPLPPPPTRSPPLRLAPFSLPVINRPTLSIPL